MRGPILLQGAMDVETDRTVDRLAERREERVGGFRFWRGRLGALELVVSRTGVGMAAAAAATALGVARFEPVLVLSQGSAGAHRADLRVGDVVVGRTCVDLHSLLTAPRGPGEGMDPAGWRLWDFAADTPPAALEGDGAWAERFLSAPWTRGRVLAGRLGSGDVFNREHDRISWLREQAGADCEDMESAAVYQVCRRLGTACLGVRIISNNELTGAAYRREVGEDLQDLVWQVLSAAEGGSRLS